MEKKPDAPIISRPLYSPISIQHKAAFHLFIAEQQSEENLLALFDVCQSPAKRWRVLEASSLQQGFADPEFSMVFSALPLATHLYLAGREAFLWDVHKLALDAGLLAEQISLMPPTSNSRRVFCTHCYGVMEEVSHSPVNCTGCQRLLLVRDHFSRFHGAYVGLNVNAEDANDIPPKEVLK